MSGQPRLRAVLDQLPAYERVFFEQDPALSWLAGVIDSFGHMTAEDAAKAVSAEIPGLRSLYPQRTLDEERDWNTIAAEIPIVGTVTSSGEAGPASASSRKR